MQDAAGAPLTSAEPSPSASSTSVDGGRFGPRTLLAAVALVVLVLDQVTKVAALATLTPGEPVDLVGSWIRLNIIRNPGAAFSLGDDATWVLTILSLAILVGVLVAARRVGDRTWGVTLGLLLGGAVGNLVDRFAREPGPGRGHVVDFIDYFGLFVGNVADIAIVLAAGVVMVLAHRGVPLGPGSGRHEANADD
ncbi:signal peptidase II [Phycicoccus sp. BSK3Z-2]|uniref:Lipoprotein signal peptidase n=1 Tax=Phycicoccus avicenniae TaxID=2828860 RepID=A0A941HZT0_9MICO|nr:signal peptidase II [Phycicoccus avicenniae]MBR7744428.1 signal peptidase II [Phycicoccus avicenniae]